MGGHTGRSQTQESDHLGRRGDSCAARNSAPIQFCGKDGTVSLLVALKFRKLAPEPKPGKVELLSVRAPNARQIAAAEYDPEHESVQVAFRDGTLEKVRLRT